MYLNRSTRIISNVNEEIIYFDSCRERISSWLLVHFCFTWYTSVMFIMVPVTLGFIIGRFIWVIKQIRSGNSDIEFAINDRRYTRLSGIRCRQFFKFVFSEVLLILFYVFTAFLCKLMMNNNSIYWITFARWLVEASFLPYTLGLIITGSYLHLWEDFLLQVDPKLISVLAYTCKALLCIVMRYTEMYPSSKLNDYKIVLFHHICGPPYLHRISNDYRLQSLLHSSKVR